MTAKLRLNTRVYCSILLLAFALLACIDVHPVAAASSANVAEASNRVADVRGHRHLRVHTSPTTDEDDDSSEERVLPGAETLKQLATSAMFKLTPNNQKATDKLFERLKVGTAKTKIFESGAYQQWSSSVMKAYKKKRELGQAAKFSSLKAHYGDATLAKLLVEAQQSSSTKVIATKFQDIQLQNWLNSGKTADEVFSLLKLDAVEGSLLKSPMLGTWISYVNKRASENPYELLLSKLRKSYDEAGLAKMLIAAKETTSTAPVARRVEGRQLQNWLSGGKTADDVFKVLRLDIEKGDDLLKNPALTTWFSYVRMQNHDPDKLLILKLKTRYSDETLAKMFIAARTNSNTKISVGRLEEALLASWIRGDKTADDMFNVLKLNKDGTLFESPTLGTWVSYVTKLDKENPDEVMLLVMKKHYGDAKLEKMFDQAKKSATTKDFASRLKEELWRSQGKTTDDVFSILKLDKDGDKLFTSPMFSTWVSYVNRLNKLNKKNPDEFAVISDLERRFDYADLGRMLGDAKHLALSWNSVDMFTNLQKLQFKQWMTEKGMDPKRLEKFLLQNPNDERNPRILLSFIDYYRASGGLPFY
ncbi:hypothetical protein PHYPSEUDO_011752 [Phytophthora pseudosyringae]|uniref:RxLR effector PexRD54 WY domain-containing protein n=1 Tax=Phytophthora pseudosyringae TaxID=221518 RepID=A0A8T1VAS5_9STRA|nr:hypothetical protein PHYPSEUDO_011752 [Phytophthora pseudosyringae]